MPIPVAPITFHCPHCGWSKTTAPRSDVMLRGHTWFDSCPLCQCDKLERRSATMVELLAAKVRDAIGK